MSAEMRPLVSNCTSRRRRIFCRKIELNKFYFIKFHPFELKHSVKPCRIDIRMFYNVHYIDLWTTHSISKSYDQKNQFTLLFSQNE